MYHVAVSSGKASGGCDYRTETHAGVQLEMGAFYILLQREPRGKEEREK